MLSDNLQAGADLKRAEKVRLASEAALKDAGPDTRDPAEREAARREWGQIRKDVRAAFIAKTDWVGLLSAYRDREGFYTSAERAHLCATYTDELIANGPGQTPGPND